ncbi:MAG: hypothetical protein OEW21_13635 [Betaproteobacteria bacterium]|nr:hypothetical protein [Betaproteobacteria bacterium]
MKAKFLALIFATFLLGSIVGLAMALHLAQRSSSTFVAQQLNEARSRYAVAGITALRAGNNELAESSLQGELGAILLIDMPGVIDRWPFDYPLLVGTLGRQFPGADLAKRRADQERALVLSRMAYLRESQGKVGESTILYREASRTLGLDWGELRKRTSQAVQRDRKGD